ncbi:MAG: type II toxin-antitoxin system VapC family toxin, partial [Synergistaceae bacterium]|nr:type II toxin-antitoxin system VapC family toxin [Synergistaceae bacterium]
MTFDTDVLIWFLRGNKNAAEVVEKSAPFSISIVTFMELLQGARNKQEIAKIKKTLSALNVSVILINESISLLAANYLEKYNLSDSVELADALIAATCVHEKETLFTA